MKKLEFKRKLRPAKPVIKGMLTVLIGLFLTSEFVGIGRLTSNYIFGTIAYIFIAISGLICIKVIQFDESSSEKRRFNKKQLIIIEICLFSAGLLITILDIIFFLLDFLIIIIPISIVVVWTILVYYAPKKLKNEDIKKGLQTLVFSLGLIYGAGLNTLFIPVIVYLFFSALTFSQLSRETLKGFVIKKRTDIPKYSKDSRPLEASLRLSFKLQILALVCLIVPIFIGITYPILYLWALIPTLLCLGGACYLSYKGMNEKKLFERTNILLKFGILFELGAILLSS
jgi:hypothetical protein